MQIELVPGLTNVIRFPIEDRVRPSIELIYDIQPDAREVLAVAEAFHLESCDLNLQHVVDQETATFIAEQLPPSDSEDRKPALTALLEPVMAKAVQACRQQRTIAVQAVEAQQRALAAKTAGGYWLAPLEERAEALTKQAAELLLAAYARCQEALGVNRAVGIARRGETWAAYNARADSDEWLIDLEKRRGSRPAA